MILWFVVPLKQLVIGKVTREDHGDFANGMIRLYAESKKARERQGMGFRLSRWDEQLLAIFQTFRKSDDESRSELTSGRGVRFGLGDTCRML